MRRSPERIGIDIPSMVSSVLGVWSAGVFSSGFIEPPEASDACQHSRRFPKIVRMNFGCIQE